MDFKMLLTTTWYIFLIFLMLWIMASVIIDTIKKSVTKRRLNRAKQELLSKLDEIDIKEAMEKFVEMCKEKEEK